MDRSCKYLGADGVTCYGWIVGYCYKMVTDIDPNDNSRPRRRCRDGIEATPEEEAQAFMDLEDNKQ